MSSPAFKKVLEATGYLTPAGKSVPGLVTAGDPASANLKKVFADDRVGLNADAVFTAQSSATSIFKDAGTNEPSATDLKRWHEAAWNVGVAPLLWIITPTEVRLYDCYASRAERPDDTAPSPLDNFPLQSEDRLRLLDSMCGRLATETGAFWSSAIGAKINRQHRVDRDLLEEISALEDLLTGSASPSRPGGTTGDMPREIAQRFIGRCIFTWYLLDRGIAQPFLPKSLPPDLSKIFDSTTTAFSLFKWLRKTFNGDLFPMDDPGAEREHLTDQHLALFQDFIEGRSLVASRRGQGRLFRFRFDAIPVDLISSIYQQFARSAAEDEAASQGLHYTPIELVHLTLDPVFEQLPAKARIIDPTCGSGAFLVEAFRRLVWRTTQGRPASREVVRNILYTQLFGIDINRSALGIAAFSLYLAALELDEQPINDVRDLKFDHLIDTTLFEADTIGETLPAKLTDSAFDAVVGNPPWTFVRRADGSRPRQSGQTKTLRPRRSPDQAFLSVAADLAGESGRIGMVMKATPFFSKDVHAVAARSALLERLAPVALVNLSFLRKEGLFPDATGPALLFFARCALASTPDQMLVGSIPWTPDFKRTGVFHFGPAEIRAVPLARVLRTPTVLKAATFGTVRDGWLIDKLEQALPTLATVLDHLGRTDGEFRGQGFQVHGDANEPPKHYRSLKVISPDVFTPFRIAEATLPTFIHKVLHRPRRESIFRGPLLLCPKGGNKSGAERGRYIAAVHPEDVLYTESFFGVSFRGADTTFAYVLSGILNSSITAFQFAFGGPTWGLERPTVEPHDLLSLRIPPLSSTDGRLLNAVVDAEKQAATNPEDKDNLHKLDEAVFDLYDLEADERILVRDSVARARYLIFENRAERIGVIKPPTSDLLKAYAKQVACSVDAYLRTRGERHLEAIVYTKGLTKGDLSTGVPGITAVRFVMAPGAPKRGAVVREGDPADLERLAGLLRGRFDADVPPYLNERRQLRLYGPDDLFILKPTEARYWTTTVGLNDADVILADHWLRGRDAASYA
ncbi:class I SAM-dependent DNA methyltransferase [Parvibaculum sp.]|uniref:HsdM family class I SAM-dependent methyltransferase n=1 Tax=Parvibaculum sp. TaxID=2024848 RepID=UPI00272F232A|nr:N-6 DNA methylase [Parvibaculum sp.]MDP1627376.1 N-6 DNA methylase [Parvibaculum sp.]MDP2148555.1 N-6 DNA methylase [Parvibaculum sp.]MDP3327512.1 N-6 DNA methylase [Parvibaculum sp.]